LTACKSNDDCHSEFRGTCGVTELGKRCLEACTGFRPQNFTCVDDVPTACSLAGEGHCEDCGCPSSLRCSAGQCSEKAAVGERCDWDRDCKSDNCSNFAGVCRQPIGSSCTTANCDICITSTGSSYCSRECSTPSQCGGGKCVGSAGSYYCHIPCSQLGDPGCPGDCRYTSGFGSDSVLYCDCTSPECSVAEALHPLGESCTDDYICESGNCDRAATGTDPFDGPSYRGICSKPCAASSDCGDGFSCAAAGTPHCLPRCETSCDTGGECLALPTVEGDTANVCWVKHAAGGFCRDASDCQANNCINSLCASAGPQANGSKCAANSDCVSNACQSGICRGQALQGDPCTIPADCSVGTCCTTGAQANTCALGCN
jgi:hypothetical protein